MAARPVTWFKVDDKMGSHPKVLTIPRKQRPQVMGLWLLGGIWCAGQLTNGALPRYMLAELGGSPLLAETLVLVGLWEKTEDGYQYHDWADYQPTREQVENDRAAARERMSKLRNGSRVVRPNQQRTSEDVRDPRPDPARPDQELPTEVSEKSPRKRGTRITEDWMPSPEVKSKMLAERPGVDYRTEHRNFIDHFLAASGQNATKVDWDAAWRKWMRSARSGVVNGQAARPATVHVTPPAEPVEPLEWAR